MPSLSVEQIRRVDHRSIHEFHVPSIVLMENAGRNAFQVLRNLGCAGPVIVLCGKGNNAGDGLVVARHLDVAAIPVHIITADNPARWQGDAAVNYKIVQACRIPLHQFNVRVMDQEYLGEIWNTAEWIVDALLGTGATGPPRSPMDQMIRAANRAPARRFAVDIPSGLDADTGQPHEPTFRADHTCTFVAPKTGFGESKAAAFLGQVHVVSIGAPRQVIPGNGDTLEDSAPK